MKGGSGPVWVLVVVLWVLVSIPKAVSACLSHTRSQLSCSLILSMMLQRFCGNLRLGPRDLGTFCSCCKSRAVGKCQCHPWFCPPSSCLSQSHLCMSEFILTCLSLFCHDHGQYLLSHLLGLCRERGCYHRIFISVPREDISLRGSPGVSFGVPNPCGRA